MTHPIENLRIQFFGVQGSGSTFPLRAERDAINELLDFELLRHVFQDLSDYRYNGGRSDELLDRIFGGALDEKTLRQYRQRFMIPRPRVYGGWTTCVYIETSDGYDIVLDCGSGFRNCARVLQQKWGDRPERHLHIFGSHSHLDHTEGFDQAVVCFDPRNTLHIYGNAQFLRALDSYLGIFSRHVPEEVRGVQTPIFYSIMPAQFMGTEIRDLRDEDASKATSPFGEVYDLRLPIRLGATKITPFEVYHPAPCLAFKIEHGGRTFVFCTDHELRHGPEPEDPLQKASEAAEERLIAHATGVDILYRDGQYLRSEYEGMAGIGISTPVSRLDWGHSCIEDVEEMALACGIRQTYIGHHDPNRNWSERNWMDEALARNSGSRKEKLELARAETIIDL